MAVLWTLCRSSVVSPCDIPDLQALHVTVATTAQHIERRLFLVYCFTVDKSYVVSNCGLHVIAAFASKESVVDMRYSMQRSRMMGDNGCQQCTVAYHLAIPQVDTLNVFRLQVFR